MENQLLELISRKADTMGAKSPSLIAQYVGTWVSMVVSSGSEREADRMYLGELMGRMTDGDAIIADELVIAVAREEI